MIPIRFLSEVNGKSMMIWQVSSPPGVFMTIFFGSLYTNVIPIFSAIQTNAISSGLLAYHYLYPSSSTGVTLWHRLNAVTKSLTTTSLFLFYVLYLFSSPFLSLIGYRVVHCFLRALITQLVFLVVIDRLSRDSFLKLIIF